MKKIVFGLVLLFAFITYTEASADSPIALRRSSNLANKLLGVGYNVIRFLSNGALIMLNFALRMSESLFGRIIHKFLRAIASPLFAMYKIYRVVSWPVRLLLRPVKAVVRFFAVKVPRRIVKRLYNLLEFIIPSNATPFPYLPNIEFLYGH